MPKNLPLIITVTVAVPVRPISEASTFSTVGEDSDAIPAELATVITPELSTENVVCAPEIRRNN